ncbi:hypothetical protein CPB84DRAFT_661030 [Gymnopilus junonius]|uniref:Uncharacterized protein n=1 Tax=Gymnopilus junonius TaxID=109634 RepID=A0A9P5N8N5_GYMJU|nr:hypothetical protein CPB84DRAFT_661030 [Gymnopilus junonius]
MAHPKKWHIHSAAHARAAKKVHPGSSLPLSMTDDEINIKILGDMASDEIGILSDREETRWNGGIENITTDSSDFSWEELSTDEELDSSDDEGHTGLDDKNMMERDALPTVNTVLMKQHTSREWKKAESNRSLGYTGNSACTQRRKEKMARDKEAEDEKLRKMSVQLLYFA